MPWYGAPGFVKAAATKLENTAQGEAEAKRPSPTAGMGQAASSGRRGVTAEAYPVRGACLYAAYRKKGKPKALEQWE